MGLYGQLGCRVDRPAHSCQLAPSLASCLQMDVLEMLPDVDADISTFPVGDGLVIEVAERPTSPASRVLDQASTRARLGWVVQQHCNAAAGLFCAGCKAEGSRVCAAASCRTLVC